METIELQRKLIEHYQQVIELCKRTPKNEMRKVIISNYAEYGICYASHALFDVVIMHSEWVINECKGSRWWAECPKHASVNKLIPLLQYRVDVLQRLVSGRNIIFN